MSAKRGPVSIDDTPATQPGDWSDAFVTHSIDELRAAVTARRTRGPNKRETKEQVAVRFSPEVLTFFRATGPGWQTRMDQALRDYVAKHRLSA
ncbi:BrnA antitoxin family protein [Rugamonas rubra]|uniref:BrnA antitoxin family protein n=1 Tax=Rugamonas rubra TaxID=758825 RepID=UPI000B84CCC3|nr:BrnA antitoxin family protein [Rugamonas rubra]